jgi:ABC-type Fe3+ transport system substrate-binding protein
MMKAAVVAALLAGACLFAGQARADDWQAGAGPEWQKLLAAGQKEGSLAVAGRGEMALPMTAAFKRDTGISLEFLGGEGREQFTRLAREMRAGQVTIDVIFDGQSLVPFVNDGYIKPIKPQFLLPGVTDLKNWQNGKMKWVDKEQEYMFEGSEYVFGWILIDTDVIKPGELTSWKDLLKPEYKGKIASFDPRVGGPGQANASYIADVFGIDFVKHLYADQKVVLSNSSRQLVDWVAHGNYPIALATLATEIESFRAAGVSNLAAIYMKDGPGAVLGGSSVISEPKLAPHPNATAVFLNWYASQPGQQVFSTVWKTPSNRTDVHVDGIPDYVVPKPGVQYVDQYVERWYLEKYIGQYQKALVEAIGR